MTNWYIAKIRPGAGRAAKDRIGLPHERRDETIVERSLRDEGFGCYYPRMRKEIRHHRTNKIIVRRFPLFASYVFVNGLSRNGVSVLDCDGVSYILGCEGRPLPIPVREIAGIRMAEKGLEFDKTEEARIRRREQGRTMRETIAMRYPAGARVQIGHGPFAGFHGHVTSVTGRGRVQAMLNLFGGLTPCEFDAADLEAA